LAGSPALVSELEKVRLPYNLPTLSQTLATAALTELAPELTTLVAHVRSERERVTAALSPLSGVQVIPSQANFLWLKLARPAGEVFTALGKQGVLVRSFHGRGGRMEQCLRVTIGTQSENDRCLEALRASL